MLYSYQQQANELVLYKNLLDQSSKSIERKTLAKLRQPRKETSLAVFNEATIFIIGGITGKRCSTYVSVRAFLKCKKVPDI